MMALAMAFACSQINEKANIQTDALAAKSTMTMAEVSELSKLMKDMHKNAKTWRKSLANGDMVIAEADIYVVLTESSPTKKNVAGPAFNGFASYYQERLNDFLSAKDIDLAQNSYNNLVTACVQCHQSYCTGPIPAIKKLYLP
jgi:cytochrome c553